MLVNRDLHDISIDTYKEAYANSFKTLNLQWIQEYFVIEEEDIGPYCADSDTFGKSSYSLNFAFGYVTIMFLISTTLHSPVIVCSSI